MHRFILAVAAFAAFSASAAKADVSYGYVTDQSSYSAAAGASVTVYIFLQETIKSGGNSVINNDGGLYGAGFYVNQTTTNGSSVLQAGKLAFNTNSGTSTTGGAPAGFYSNGTYVYTPNSATQQGGFENINNNTQGPITSNISAVGSTNLANTITSAIYLGSIQITAGAAGTTTNFTLQKYGNFSGSDGNTITFNSLYDLDVPGSNGVDAWGNVSSMNFSVNVAAVPEPSSMLLCGFAICGMGYTAYRRRKTQGQTPLVAA
jgi:hypothetical protein